MKIGFISLGCPKNLVDSEVMLGLATQAGHRLTNEPSQADVLVVNTCAFIDRAKQESIDAILEMAAQKDGRRVRLVVTGCLAERYRQELQREIPEIDVLLGTDEVPDIVRAIEGTGPGIGVPGRRSGRNGTKIASAPVRLFRGDEVPMAASGAEGTTTRPLPTYLYDAQTPRILTTPGHYAYVKVAEGCNYTCAFCIIPKLRGAYRSRPAASVVEEAKRLASQGVRELILISQDTTFYGVDRGETGALATLLRELDRIEGIQWIRLLYLYPTTVDDSVLDAMAGSQRVCRYVDLPLQHASPDVLKRMGRPGTGDSYRRLLSRIRARVPGVTLRTTFIVGFPGETDDDFGQLHDFMREMEFDHVGVFTYSHEEGTRAYTAEDDVPDEVKGARRDALMETQLEIVAARNRGRIGQRVRVLVDGPSPDHELVRKGRTEWQAPDIDSVVYLSDCDPATTPAGTLLDVEIVAAHDYDLVARPLDRHL